VNRPAKTTESEPDRVLTRHDNTFGHSDALVVALTFFGSSQMQSDRAGKQQREELITMHGFKPVCKLVVVSALAALAVNSAVAGPVTFAQYFQSNGAQQQWAISTSGDTTTVTASGPVDFLFSGISGLPFSGAVDAMFTLTATSAQVGNCGVDCGAGDSFVQPGYSGTFSFLDTDSGAYDGANLLSGTFAVTGSPSTTGAQFSAHMGSTSGSFDASATAGNLEQLVMTSTFLNFNGQDDEDASWSLSSLVPNFTVGVVSANQAFPSGTFDAAGAGTFSSSPGPSGVPEPNTFFNLIGGGALLGLLARGRRFLRH
jgi:hypothetical protein